MRKLISILLLVCLCLAILGYHLVFYFQLQAIKSEMRSFLKNGKDHKDVLLFSFNAEQCKGLYWENENEFSYKGEMYDVIEKKYEQHQLIIHCIPDEKETALLNEYQKNNKHNSSNSTIVHLITAPFILPCGHFLKQPETIIRKIFMDHFSSLQNPASSVLPQPPDIC